MIWNELYPMVEDVNLEDISDAIKVSLVYHHQCLSRDRRYLYAYFQHRLSKIRTLRWETGAVIPEDLRPNLSDRENDYFMEYNSILSEYCQSIGNLDITSDLNVINIIYY